MSEEKTNKGETTDVAGKATDVAGKATDVAGKATGGAGEATGGAGKATGGAGEATGGAGEATCVASNVLSPDELSKLEKLLLENPSLWEFLSKLMSKEISDGLYGQYLRSVDIGLTSEELGFDECLVDPTELVKKRCLILYWDENPDYEDTNTCMGAYSDYVRILYYNPEDNQLLLHIQRFWGGSCDGFGNSDDEQIHHYFDWIKLGNTLSLKVSDRTKLDIILRYEKNRKKRSIRGLSDLPIEIIESFL